MTTMAQQASLLALDWGTSSLRAYLLDAEGKTLAERQEPWGLMQVSSVTGCQGTEAFNAVFDRILSDWPDLSAAVPVIAAGMVGSAQGWQEVPYQAVPCGLAQLAAKLVSVRATSGRTVWIVPGLREAGTLPNVMRGEETQIVGALAQLAALDANSADTTRANGARDATGTTGATLLGLPGSHSKWAMVEDDKLVHFDTFMTGEAFSALGNHTILARTSSASLPASEDSATVAGDVERNAAAFERGVRTALAPDTKGVLATIFSCRTLGLSGELTPKQQREYLSGLLIGAEIAGMRETLHGGDLQPNLALVGDPQLCQRYALALRLAGVGTVKPVPLIENASQQGLWQLARMAGLMADHKQ